MQERNARNDLEIANEAMAMTCLNILKYANHHCEENQDPYEITDRIFIDNLKAVGFGENNDN